MASGEGKEDAPAERLLAAAWAGDAGRMRAEVERIVGLLDRYPAGAAAMLERAALELAKVHLLDDVRRALPQELERRMGEVLRERCSPTVRAAWKYAAYDLPLAPPAEAKDHLEPFPGVAPLPPPKPPRAVPETRDPG